jgi:Flp pilus assembly protein protease CpaA
MTVSGVLQVLVDLLKDPLARSVLLTAWLLPCAIQDWRTRHVSNWLTVPLFIAAWPIAALTGTLPLTIAVFIGVYVAWASGAGMGPADGKVAVAAASINPVGLIVAVALNLGSLVVTSRMLHKRSSISGVVGFCCAGLITSVFNLARQLSLL